MELRSRDTKDYVYEFCKEFFQENLYFPTIREICDGVGLTSTSTVYYHLQNLEKMGKIKRAYEGNSIKIPYIIVGARVVYD